MTLPYPRQSLATLKQPIAMAVKTAMPHYHEGEVNHCPNCAGTHWHVGRKVAECAGCGEALTIAGGE